MTNRWGVDVSLWQDEGGLSAAQVQALADGGCSFAIIRAGQPWRADDQLARHLDNFGNAGIPVGVYFWGDPLQNANEQIDWYVSICDAWRNQISCYALDAEQWWASWAEYYRYVRGEIPMSSVPRIPPATISARYHEMANRLRSQVDKPAFVYSGGYFVRDMATGMAGWMNSEPYLFWCATYRMGPNPCTYAELQAYLSSLTSPFFDGVDSWEVWQFSSGGTNYPRLIGQNPLDLNFIPDDGVYSYLFGNGEIPPPPPPKPATVAGRTLYSMRVRSGPGTGYSTVALIPAGTAIEGNTLGGDCWLEIEPGRWVCLYKAGQKFVELAPRE